MKLFVQPNELMQVGKDMSCASGAQNYKAPRLSAKWEKVQGQLVWRWTVND